MTTADAGPGFVLTGAAGYVAPRHLAAIRANGGRLVAACDPVDATARIDGMFPSAVATARLDDLAELIASRRRGPAADRVDWLSICTPNDRHGDEIRFGLENGLDVICEKPMLLDPAGLDEIARLEATSGRRVATVLQLRLHPAFRHVAEQVAARPWERRAVTLTFATPRGPDYDASWKGDPRRSGGIATNIGIHLFDLVLQLFGECLTSELQLKTPRRMAGFLELERADVGWFLSIEPSDCPRGADGSPRPERSLEIDGQSMELSAGSASFHEEVYRQALAGRGAGIADARPSLELVQRIRTSSPSAPPSAPIHPLVTAAMLANNRPGGEPASGER